MAFGKIMQIGVHNLCKNLPENLCYENISVEHNLNKFLLEVFISGKKLASPCIFFTETHKLTPGKGTPIFCAACSNNILF
jgi:hypothetical protein